MAAPMQRADDWSLHIRDQQLHRVGADIDDRSNLTGHTTLLFRLASREHRATVNAGIIAEF